MVNSFLGVNSRLKEYHRQTDALAGISLTGIAVSVVVGVFLRVHHLNTQLVFADEIHTLAVAAANGYGYIFTHFNIDDACIPYTLYVKFVMDTVGIDELLFRLPSVIGGCATLVLLARMLWRWFCPVTAWLVVGLLAVSPYHVYLSREARPYAIVIFFLTVAIYGALTWSASGKRVSLVLTAIASFWAIYFHIIALPAVAFLFGYIWWRAIGRGAGEDRHSTWIGMGLVALLGLFFLFPALPSLAVFALSKTGQGKPQLDTLQYGLYLPLSLHPYAWLLELPLAGMGFIALARTLAPGTFLLAGMLAFQVASILLLRPVLLEIPWVWSRYVAVLLPVWLLFVANGAIALVRCLAGKHAQAIFVAVVVLAVGVYNGKDGLYAVGRNRDFNVHPMVMAHELGRNAVLDSLPASNFYRRLREHGDDGAILELPFTMVFPIYDLYQRIHRRPIFTGALGSGDWYEVFNREKRFRLRRTVDVRDREVLAALPVRYVVVHRDINSEIGTMYRSLLAFETTHHLLKTKDFDWWFTPRNTQHVKGTALLQWSASQFGPPVYEDDQVVVYTVPSLRSGSSQ